jgi:hypothetical protein
MADRFDLDQLLPRHQMRKAAHEKAAVCNERQQRVGGST